MRYVHGEDDRLASAILEILHRDMLPFDQVESWSRSFSVPDGKDWKGVYDDEQRNCAFQNTRNFLRSVYLAILAQPGDFPNREPLVVLIFESLTSLRPY